MTQDETSQKEKKKKLDKNKPDSDLVPGLL